MIFPGSIIMDEIYILDNNGQSLDDTNRSHPELSNLQTSIYTTHIIHSMLRSGYVILISSTLHFTSY